MSERDHSEYDVISIRPHAGFLSLLCAVVPITFGILADDLPFMLGGRLRPYYGHLFMAGLGASVIGIVFGIMAIRRPEQRSTGRLGVLVNAVALVLLTLFILVFRWIRWGGLSWF